MIDLTALKDFIDLGGMFLLSVLMVYWLKQSIDKTNDKLDKVLAILYVLVKQNTDFNHISNLLGNESEKVIEKVNKAVNGNPQQTP